MGETPQQLVCGRILFVDKDAGIRKMMEMALSDRFQVVAAHSAESGMELLNGECPFEIVVSGYSLSGMNGLDFLRRVGEQYPGTIRVLVSGGFLDISQVTQAVSEGHISRLVLKPFNIFTLLEQLTDDLLSRRAADQPTGTAGEL